MKTSNAKEEKIKEKDPESKFVKVKRMLSDSLSKKTQTQTPSNYEDAKIMCKARKRKERQESTGSISQERKVIRSNSEEKLTDQGNDANNKDIRRVVSHEDFQKNHPLHERNDTMVVSYVDLNIDTKCSNFEALGYDDGEPERRRYHERFAPLLIQRGRRSTPGRKYKNKHFSKSRKHKEDTSYKENGVCPANNNNELKIRNKETLDPNYLSDKQSYTKSTSTSPETYKVLPLPNKDEKEVSPSPNHTPVSSTLDLSTLHQQIDSSEPMPSSSSQEITDQTETLPSLFVASTHLLSSPRNSIMVTNRIYLDPNVQQTTTSLSKEPKSPLEKKLKQLSKQINALKRKIKGFDEEFQQANGYKPSQADKLNDKNMRKFCFELGKLKKEYKQLKGENNGVNFTIDGNVQDIEKTLQITVGEIEKNLTDKRLSSDRCEQIEEMSNEQIVDEKIAVQKALLYLESIYGRPTTKEDRDIVRPLYDRYRSLKRIMGKICVNSGTLNELATIHEHETMDFVSSPPQLSESDTSKLVPSTSDSDTDMSLGESFHTLTISELVRQQKDTSEEKKKLKRALKEFENEIFVKTGRKLLKDDKALMADVYTSYKQTKAKLRLLEALVKKQKSL